LSFGFVNTLKDTPFSLAHQITDDKVLALLLEGARVDLDHLVVQEKGKTPQGVKGTLTPGEARRITQKLPALHNETDVLQAFMKALKGER
jgi:hypothetical protein